MTKPILRNEPELKEFFFNPSFLRNFPAIDELLVGLTLTAAQRADDNFSDDVSIHTLTYSTVLEERFAHLAHSNLTKVHKFSSTSDDLSTLLYL